MHQIELLGRTMRDVVTGFQGVVTGVVSYLTGCEQVLLAPPVKSDGTRQDGHWFDLDRCEATEVAAIQLPRRTAAGFDIAPPVR